MAAGTEDYLLLSGIQHFCFAAVNGPSSTWSSSGVKTSIPPRGGWNTPAAMTIHCLKNGGPAPGARNAGRLPHRLRLSGVCDVVEFRADPAGVPLWGREGLWMPLPVEYKHGRTKESDADRLQLCAQAMALEEMLVCEIPPVRCFMKKQDTGAGSFHAGAAPGGAGYGG